MDYINYLLNIEPSSNSLDILHFSLKDTVHFDFEAVSFVYTSVIDLLIFHYRVLVYVHDGYWRAMFFFYDVSDFGIMVMLIS